VFTKWKHLSTTSSVDVLFKDAPGNHVSELPVFLSFYVNIGIGLHQLYGNPVR